MLKIIFQGECWNYYKCINSSSYNSINPKKIKWKDYGNRIRRMVYSVKLASVGVQEGKKMHNKLTKSILSC